MAKQNTLHAIHVQRNDTAENWTRVNPILQKGEMGVETDTLKFKFGDGVKHWAELDYEDKTLSDALAAETTRATQRENAIEAAYKAADTAEQSRATGEETAIRSEFAAADGTTLESAKSYTDTRETAIRSDMTAGDAKTLADAKKHAESKIAELVNSAPTTLDTLNELAEALGNDPNFASTVAGQIGRKADTTYVDEKLAKKADKSTTLDGYGITDAVKNTMAVKATKLDAGQNPTIAYDKTGNILTVGIPKGDKGDTGPTGPAGAKGETGAAGAKGADGTGIGTITVTSDGTHLTTPTCTVTPGAVSGGKQPFTLAFKGLQGAQGAQGVPGAQGAQGATGAAGKSAYEIWKAQSGNSGKSETEFLASIKGAKGDTGAKGDKGDTGAAGAAAGFGTPTASVDTGVGTPSVKVTASGPDTAKVFSFAFSNLKGDKGDTGAPGKDADTSKFLTTPDLSGATLRILTQSEYDSLSVKSATTLYIATE